MEWQRSISITTNKQKRQQWLKVEFKCDNQCVLTEASEINICIFCLFVFTFLAKAKCSKTTRTYDWKNLLPTSCVALQQRCRFTGVLPVLGVRLVCSRTLCRLQASLQRATDLPASAPWHSSRVNPRLWMWSSAAARWTSAEASVSRSFV